MVIMKMLRSAGSSRKGGPMVLIRLEHHEHPASPQHEMRQKAVLDSGDEIVGTVENLYADDDRLVHFMDVTTSGGSLAQARSTIWSLWKP